MYGAALLLTGPPQRSGPLDRRGTALARERCLLGRRNGTRGLFRVSQKLGRVKMHKTEVRILFSTLSLAALFLLLLSPTGPAWASPVTEAEKGNVVRLPKDAYEVQEPLLYQVQRGDDLHWLAAKFYGDARQWVKIYEANRSAIANPNRLQIGQTLTIPAHVTAR